MHKQQLLILVILANDYDIQTFENMAPVRLILFLIDVKFFKPVNANRAQKTSGAILIDFSTF